jgi:hypothetical protein
VPIAGTESLCPQQILGYFQEIAIPFGLFLVGFVKPRDVQDASAPVSRPG